MRVIRLFVALRATHSVQDKSSKMGKPVIEARNEVKQFLVASNRPYSCNDIANNFQNKLTKANISKALDALVTSSEINERVNGKQKIYFALQDNSNIDEKKLKEINDKVQEYTRKVEENRKAISAKQEKYKLLKAHTPIEELEGKLDSLRKEVEQLRTKLSNIESKSSEVCPEDHSKIKKKRDVLVEEWKKRKRIASDVMDAILENYPKNKRAFIEEVGIETDEDVNAVTPE